MDPDKLLNATLSLEAVVDQELDALDLDDYEKVRERRLKTMKEEQAKRIKYVKLGHGTYDELPDEKAFFALHKKSARIVCHFYTPTAMRCKIVDMHLQKLTPQHMETKFCKLDITRCPFLAERLKVCIIPTIVMIKEAVLIDRIVGFTELGNCDDFSTEMLEWRIAQSKTINYEDDLKQLPDNPIIKKKLKKKAIRGGDDSDDSDDDEYVRYDEPLEGMKFSIDEAKVIHFSENYKENTWSDEEALEDDLDELLNA